MDKSNVTSVDSGRTERRDFLRTAVGASAGVVASAMAVEAAGVPSERKATAAKVQGFYLPLAVNNEELGKKFVEDPEGFLKELNLDPDSLACPDEVHKTFERTQRCSDEFDKELRTTKQTPLDIVSVARRVIPKHLGDDYQVTIQPFGLQFRQRIPVHDLATLGSTISGSFTVTFLDKDTDVDS